MTTTSYPAKGLGGNDIAEWTKEWGGQNGIVNDLTGNSFSLTRVDATNTATIGTGQVRAGGYVLEVTASHDLVVSTSAATYHIWACYDPALNVADGSGNASANGPCTLGISSGAPSTAGGKIYQLLYTITRGASQALTAATVTDYRVWTGPILHMPSTNTIPSGLLTDPVTAVTGFSYPVGSRLVYGDGMEYTLVKSGSGVKWSGGASGSWTPTWDTAGGGGFTSVGGAGFNQGIYQMLGNIVHAEFRIQLASGFTLDSGTFVLNLPVTAYSGWGGSVIQSTVGNWTARKDSVPYHYSGSLGIWSSARTSVSFNGSWDTDTASGGPKPRARIDSNDPITWAAGDVLSGNLTYRAA